MHRTDTSMLAQRLGATSPSETGLTSFAIQLRGRAAWLQLVLSRGDPHPLSLCVGPALCSLSYMDICLTVLDAVRWFLSVREEQRSCNNLGGRYTEMSFRDLQKTGLTARIPLL